MSIIKDKQKTLAKYVLGRVTNIGVVGNNLPVIRLAAGNGRVRTPGIWEILEAPLSHVATHNWRVSWYAVRRCYNKAADELATHGTHRAVNQAASSSWRPEIHVWVAPALDMGVPDESRFPWHDTWELQFGQNPLAAAGIPPPGS